MAGLFTSSQEIQEQFGSKSPLSKDLFGAKDEGKVKQEMFPSQPSSSGG